MTLQETDSQERAGGDTGVRVGVDKEDTPMGSRKQGRCAGAQGVGSGPDE